MTMLRSPSKTPTEYVIERLKAELDFISDGTRTLESFNTGETLRFTFSGGFVVEWKEPR